MGKLLGENRFYSLLISLLSKFPNVADVPPVTTNMKNIYVPATSVVSLARDNFKKQTEEEYMWLEHARRVIEDNTETDENISWSALHASRQPQLARTISPTALLPLFLDSAHTVAMIRHSMDVVKNTVEHVNPGQTPVATLDQPLFALAKQIQWKWPEKYGEDKMVVMFGGLHIEMAALKTLGDWLRGSGWVQALVQAEIATPGTADSFLRAAHVTRTRRAHQITATTLHILQRRAYTRHYMTDFDDVEYLPEFEDWCQRRAKDIPPLSVLGNCAGTRDAGTGLRAFTATGCIRDVACCPDGTGAMVPCPRPYTLCQVDPCSPEAHGSTPNEAPRCIHGIWGWQLHCTEDEERVLFDPN